ncbi:MAG: sulfatase-like hydrolase/transferase [bacterium]|nr:sulfatase-like hydrolase/transferase [bacterium]
MSQPNILLLFVDQMRYDAMACAGNPVIQTPGLDRLAREGIHFTHSVTPVPVCVAARHSLLMGHQCATHGRFANNTPEVEPNLYTLPQLLGSAGYVTRAIGKMHFRPARRHYGFHRMELMEEIPHYRENDEYLMYLKENGYGHIRQVHGVRNLLYHQPQVSVIPEEHHSNTWVADRTIDFLSQHRDRPFFCWSSWIAPHLPWNAPEPFASMYPIDEVDPPHNWDQPRETLPPLMKWSKETSDTAFASMDHLKRIRALYYGNISLIDKGVGRILRALDALDLADNTLVFFASDHGELMGDHGAFQKSKPYEASMRVPLLMRLPGRVEAGRTSRERVSLLDIMPTCLDLAGIDYPGEPALAGASLLGASGGGLASPREELVVEHGGGKTRWLSLLRGPWKYNYYFLGGWEELFHLEDDPLEMNNLLLENPSSEARAQGGDMKQALTGWEKAHGFATSLDENGELIRSEVPQTPPRTTNNQFPVWVDNLPPEEKAQMESLGDSVLNAMQHEWTYQLTDLNLKAYKEGGGNLDGTQYQHLLDEL